VAAVPALNKDNIQGNVLAGFSKDFQSFLFVNFPAGGDPKVSTGDPKGWLAEITSDVATTSEVEAFNALFKQIRARRKKELGTVEATWMNVALSASGLELLGVSPQDLQMFDASFRAGMKARAAEIGDKEASDPEHWLAPLGSRDVHALLLLASDDLEDLDEAVLRNIDAMSKHGLRLAFRQEGRARTDLAGHEHFGFKDGVSQPGIRGVTVPDPNDPNQGQPGQDLLWPGEFVLGYPTQQKHPKPPPPIPGPPEYGKGQPPPEISPSDIPTEPGPNSANGPAWASDGSYLVFRRLAQDVPAFNGFVTQTAGTAQKPEALIGAKLVGRYKSGCPLEIPTDKPPNFDTQTADPSNADPTLLGDNEINNFEYDRDPNGEIVPRAAHIRKVYPRNEPTPGGGEADAQTHRLLRRGIAYGDPYDPGAPAGTSHAGDADRGLLFLCYQRSLEDQFEFVQKLWVNNPNFPQPTDGQDPIIAQEATNKEFNVPGLPQPQLHLAPFVTTTGGEYFFQPSISALQRLSES
jgi:Dyp-type peroxidase family